MELKQFINTMMKNQGLRSLLPVSQGLLYPCFAVREGKLCAHFLANASAIRPEGMVQHMPLYHVTALYPEGYLVGIENLKYNPAFEQIDFDAFAVIPKRDPVQKQQAKEQLQELTRLVNEVLDTWDREQNADLTAYHEQLLRTLLPQQQMMYQKVMGW